MSEIECLRCASDHLLKTITTHPDPDTARAQIRMLEESEDWIKNGYTPREVDLQALELADQIREQITNP